MTYRLVLALLAPAALIVLSSSEAMAASRCASLAAQWQTAKAANATNPKLGQAKVWANSAAHDCSKDEALRQSDGADEYIKALKLLGVTPK